MAKRFIFAELYRIPSRKTHVPFQNSKRTYPFSPIKQKNGKTIGFVPTMGALHEGHLALVHQAIEENDISISSIFVNPTQFNEISDLDKYPRTPSKDILLLSKVGNDILFMPIVTEIYPESNTTNTPGFDFKGLDERLEGAHRPGHFQGVAQIVSLLLEIVQPTRLYMGQKDFQQVAIIRSLIQQTKLAVDLVMSPIVRDADGLALSSRNVRLTEAERNLAPAIFQALSRAKQQIGEKTPNDICIEASDFLSSKQFMVDYFDIIDGNTLKSLAEIKKESYVVACVAATLGDVRLIDNMILQKPWKI